MIRARVADRKLKATDIPEILEKEKSVIA